MLITLIRLDILKKSAVEKMLISGRLLSTN